MTITPCRIDPPVDGRAYCHDCQMIHAGHLIALSQALTEDAQKWRDNKKHRNARLTSGGKLETKALPYTRTQIVASYLTTLAKHKAGGSVMVSNDVHNQRRETCNACEYRDMKRDACRICSCKLSPSELEATIIGDKLRWAVAECPLKPPKWTATV